MKYTGFLADFHTIFPSYSDCYAVCNVKNANIWHDCYALITPKEAYTISLNLQNILSIEKGLNTLTVYRSIGFENEK